MLLSCGPLLNMAAPVTQLVRLAAQPLWSNFTAFERPMEPVTSVQPAAGPGPSSQRLGGLALWNIASNCEQRRHCRWLGETRCQTVTAVDLGTPQANTAVALMESKVHSDADVRMDAQVIFEACWRRFEEKFRLKSVNVPREVVWLNGAPGAGKGANTQHILKTRGLDHSVNLSSLLQTNESTRALMERGELIPDSMVGDVVLEALLVQSCQIPECGVLVDGFPRTAMQVDFLKLLYDKLDELHGIFANTTHRSQFPRPLFKVVMLYVDEDTSIMRQLERAKLASVHNKRVLDAGAGQLWEQRSTDLSIEKAKKRYAIFRQHHSAVLRLKQFFPFHLIDAMGTLAETQEAITTELRYQSSLDLSYETYASIRHLPLARDVSQHARQQLVMRLDNHSERYPDLFQKVIDLITSEIMPLIHECGLAGRAQYATEHRMFLEHPRAAQMLIDVLTDRGYNVSHSTEVTHVPMQIDLQTGLIKNRKEYKHRFHVNWDTKGVREMARAMELAARISEVGGGGNGSARISQTYIPQQLNREMRSSVLRQQLAEGNGKPLEEAEREAEHVIHGS
ncbi:hypothetical protein VaNZ11_009113 [Volvox africanus]|uniref:adenylate kinase n=1 Tax=Volvox africanus TaxID=51714 RepID=A0ABQ5S6T7_9CHLO|nr:hypothetical protein VaNZ11_009113 [Volvox africanus]